MSTTDATNESVSPVRSMTGPGETDKEIETMTEHFKEPARMRDARAIVSFYPAEQGHLAEAVRRSGCTVAPLGSVSRGLVVTERIAAGELEGILSRYPRLEWVQLPSAGVDTYLSAIRSIAGSKLTWTSAKGAYSQPVAEHALALSLALLRVLHHRARTTSWTGASDGMSLAGLNVLVIGAGGVAIEIIRLLRAFGAVVTVVRRKPQDVDGAKLTVGMERLPGVLASADLVIVAAALTVVTSGLLGRAELAAIKHGANIVNIARGGLIDSDALLSALRSGRVAGAALDVTDPEPLPDGHPLWTEPGVLITPHSADTPAMKEPLLAERVGVNAAALHRGGDFVGVIDGVAGY